MRNIARNTVLILASVGVLAATGCHEKKTGNGAEAESPVFVEDYSGPARNFSGNYTSSSSEGYCRLAVGRAVYTNCQISILIQQTNRRFNIRSTFKILNPASNRNATIKNIVVESLRMDENVLSLRGGPAGVVGKQAFRYRTDDSELSMANDGLGKFRLTGSYLTEAGERVTISGRVGFPRRGR